LARARLAELKNKIAAIVPPVLPAVAPRPMPAEPAVVAPPATAPGISNSCNAEATTVSLSSGCATLSVAKERALKPKDSFKECDQCPEIVVVPSGSFTMGSPDSERDRNKKEGPRHQVTFKRPFAVGKFDVTVDQFAAFVAETGYDTGSECVSFESGEVNEFSGRSWRARLHTERLLILNKLFEALSPIF
jgi:formylglycine-generating enzyme required for sulfatase activity